MSSHRQGGAPQHPIPNWLRVFYATLVFMAFVITLTTLVHK